MGRSAMPNDLNVKAVGPVLGSSENPAQPKPETFTPPAQAPPASAPIIIANPTLRFDTATGLVVIEFRDESGNVTTSVPTLRQLEAYRQWGAASPAEAPAATGVHSSATLKA